MLTALVLVPLLGALLTALVPNASAKLVAVVAGVVGLVLSGLVLAPMLAGSAYAFTLRESADWLPTLGVKWSLGVDGLAAWMLVATAAMTLAAMGMAWRMIDRAKPFFALILLLESFIFGAFLSLDLVLFFTFFELTLFPVFFLIAGWGGEKRRYAATKFFAYTFLGSILMLVGIVAIGFRTGGTPTFDLVQLQALAASGQLWEGARNLETWTFWGFAVALLVKTPAFPFHTWMPDAYAESPSVVPVLSGVLVKLGTFGILRFLIPLFPDAMVENAWVLMLLGVVGILWAGVLAVVQRDARRLLAYSSISHMGFILVGLASLSHAGLMGAGVQMVNHTIIAGGMILLLSFLIERKGTADLAAFGGLKARMPIAAALFLVVMLGSVGLPGLSGFVGEFLSLLGAYESGAAGRFNLNVAYAVAATFGVVLSAAYLLTLFQRLFYGLPKPTETVETMPDLDLRERGLGVAVCAAIVVLGLQPSLVTRPIENAMQAARLMSVAPVGSRPLWSDATMKIDAEGDLMQNGTIVTPGAVHPVRVETADAREDHANGGSEVVVATMGQVNGHAIAVEVVK